MQKKKHQSNEYCIENKFIEQKSYKITASFIGKVYEKAKQLGKRALLVLSLPADDGEIYVLRCEITKEKI